MQYITFLKIAHLLGLMAGFGGALYTDYLMVTRGIFRKLKPHTLREIERVSHIVILGLLLLWVSGIALAVEIIQMKPEFMQNDKFWAKVVIVVVLTINGILIHSYVLKQAKANVGRRLLLDTTPFVTSLLAIFGAVSAVSWTTPFILGKAPEFSYVVPFNVIITLWVLAILLVSAFVLAFVGSFDLLRNRSHVIAKAA